jgi:hypothetical protein
MEREIENMRKLGKAFLERETYETVIPEWKRQLETFKGRPPGTVFNWAIPETSPIQTKVSNGGYEPASRRGRKVFGRISGKWQIRIPQLTGKKKGSSPKTFILLGLASTRITVWTAANSRAEEEIARWTVEVGDDSSPGCHFHTQITLDGNMFPGYLSVPRLPGLLHTPMDALEFLLSELFQEDWFKNVSRETDELKQWAGCQRMRLLKLTEWQLNKISQGNGSPWTTFKKQKPPIDVFYNEAGV